MTVDKSQIDALIQQLVETDGLTDSLTDDDAQMMLDWAQNQITQLAAQSVTLPQLESYARQIERVVKSCNRLVGRKVELSDTQMLQQLLGLVEKSIQLAQSQAISLSGQEAEGA